MKNNLSGSSEGQSQHHILPDTWSIYHLSRGCREHNVHGQLCMGWYVYWIFLQEFLQNENTVGASGAKRNRTRQGWDKARMANKWRTQKTTDHISTLAIAMLWQCRNKYSKIHAHIRTALHTFSTRSTLIVGFVKPKQASWKIAISTTVQETRNSQKKRHLTILSFILVNCNPITFLK